MSGGFYLCSICGREITGAHVRIRTRGSKERHVHFACVPGNGKERQDAGNEKAPGGVCEKDSKTAGKASGDCAVPGV